MAHWTFLSNHAHVMLLLWGDPDLRMREIAEQVQITERAVQRVIHDLIEDGYLEVTKEGRRNHYTVRDDLPMRHPIEANAKVSCLIGILQATQGQ